MQGAPLGVAMERWWISGGRSPRGFGAHLGNPNEAQRHNEDPKEGSP